MPKLVIFLDDGGVMNDGLVRHEQWKRMLAEFFAPRLGGTPEAWSEANTPVITRMLEFEPWVARLRASRDYASFDRQYWIDWLQEMCELVGVPAPGGDECVELGHAVSRYITPRVRSAFPGAVDAIRALHRGGYILHTASGESSADLEDYLKGMDVRGCFGTLYGPDLIDTFKNGPEYYERIFAHAGVAPHDALVVDDDATVVGWASQTGARTVLVAACAPANNSNPTLCLGSLAELPALIESLG